MIVSDLKKITPIADVAVIDPQNRYLIELAQELPVEEIRKIAAVLKEAGIKGLIVEHGTKFYELQP